MDEPDITLSPNHSLDEQEDLALQAMIDRMKSDQRRFLARSVRGSAPPLQLREIPEIGYYMLPSEDSYAAHRELVCDATLPLEFGGNTMQGFDGYFTAAPLHLQENLAIIRNAIMTHFFRDKATQQHVDQLADMARFLNKRFASGWQPTADGHGAQAIYLALLDRQHTPLWRMPSAWFSRNRPQRWGLPALDDSAFSESALNRPAPGPDIQIHYVDSVSFVEMADRNQMTQESAQVNQEQNTAQELNAIANDMASAGALTMSVEQLEEPTRRESIRLAKEILDKLKVKLGTAFIGHGLSQFEMEALAILGELKEAVKAFEFHLHKVAGLDAKIYENPAIIQANQAIGKLSFLAKQETLAAALTLGDAQMAALVQADLSQLPKSWVPGEQETFASLFSDLESGLDAVLSRINQLADKDAGAEYWLGFSTERGISNAEPSVGDQKKPIKAMEDDQYYRQLNAQRAVRARQAAIRYTMRMQRQRQQQQQQDDHEHLPPQPSKPTASMSALLSDDALNTIRNSLKTSANAAPVETGNKANLQNVIKQKEQVMKSQRQRVTQEQIRRANKRNQELHEDHSHPEPSAPPPHKKKDHSHGL